MSKNIVLKGSTYSGVSFIDVKTDEGENARFQDTDEIISPSGSLQITENGPYNVSQYAEVIVEVISGENKGISNISTGKANPISTYQLWVPVDKSKGIPIAIMTWSDSAYQAYGKTCGHMVFLNGYNLNGVKDVFGIVFVNDSVNGIMMTTFNKSEGNGYDSEKGYLMDRYGTANSMDQSDEFNYIVFYKPIGSLSFGD